MKKDRFVQRWRNIRVKGFNAYLLSRASIWTIIMFPLLRIFQWYFTDKDPLAFGQLYWELPMFFMSGISFALIFWIVNNYLYAKQQENLLQKITIIMTENSKNVPFYFHLLSGLTTALGGWTLLKIFKIFTSSVAEQFTPEKLKMEAMIWGPAILLFAVYSWWKDNKKSQ